MVLYQDLRSFHNGSSMWHQPHSLNSRKIDVTNLEKKTKEKKEKTEMTWASCHQIECHVQGRKVPNIHFPLGSQLAQCVRLSPLSFFLFYLLYLCLQFQMSSLSLKGMVHGFERMEKRSSRRMTRNQFFFSVKLKIRPNSFGVWIEQGPPSDLRLCPGPFSPPITIGPLGHLTRTCSKLIEISCLKCVFKQQRLWVGALEASWQTLLYCQDQGSVIWLTKSKLL